MNKILIFVLTSILLFSCKTKKEPPKVSSEKTEVIHCAPLTTDKTWYSSNTKAPLLNGLEGIDFAISTINKEAQRYFNQGLMLAYGFNHAEAARSFYEATRIDSTCAMAYWGFAYVLGPNYNAGMEDDNYQRAYQASQKALQLSISATEKEQALIKALSFRYAPTPPKDRHSLDSAYSAAMKKVQQQFPNDPDVNALYVESIMDMHPWDLYVKKTKEPRPWTPEIVAILESLIKKYPKHPGAPHFYIHAVEASKRPERALASADLLLTLVPGSGHLVHMPSHIYIWTGDYHKGSIANSEAVKIDSAYVTSCHAQGAYPLSYFPHNYHYLTATATFEGNEKLAWEAAMKVRARTAEEIMRQPGWGTLQHYYTIPYYVAVKFQLWDTILAIKPGFNDLIYPKAILHYARGMALVAKEKISEAEKEWEALSAISKDPGLKEITIWGINSSEDIVRIATNVLAAQLHRAKKDYAKAIELYKVAIEIEDNLNYDEPPDWFFSVRHFLGGVYLECGKFKEAEKTYREDLTTYKDNGWALFGLFLSLKNQAKPEATSVKKKFDESWRYANTPIEKIIQ